MTTRTIKKNLAGEEDILYGEGTVIQTRNDASYNISKVHTIKPVSSLTELNALDTEKFTKAVLFDGTEDTFTAYQYDAGSGLWEIRPITVIIDSATYSIEKYLSNRHVISVKDYGAIGNDSDDKTAITNAWNAALAAGADLYFPTGTYTINDANFPFKQSGTPTSLLDCKNLTIFGDGPSTILKTSSVNGADVLQLNGVKNLHIRNLQTKAVVSGSASGSNGISVTNGFDNITLLDIYCKDMPSIDSGSFADGGKGLTIQPATTVNDCGSLVARIIADGCSAGFGYDLDLVTAVAKNTSIRVELTALNCYRGIGISAGAATGAISTEANLGITVNATLVDCQQDVVLSRVHGCEVNADVVTTKTIAARRLNPNSIAWVAADTEVSSLICIYAKNSIVNVKGNKGACDYKARIGGAAQGASGLNGATEFCDIYLDVTGTSVTSDITAVNNGGNILNKSKVKVTDSTASTLPTDFAAITRLNHLEHIGSYGNSIIPGNIQFPATQVPSTDPNCLDDYVEGTFTPILADASLTDEGATYVANVGFYTKIGDRVYFNIYLELSGKGSLTAGDAAAIIGLPYTSKNSIGNLSTCQVGFASGLTLSAAGTVDGRILSNVSHISLQKWLATSTTGSSNLLISDIGTSAILILAGHYKV